MNHQVEKAVINIVVLFTPSCAALRKTGRMILREFKHDAARKCAAIDELKRLATGRPTPYERNPEIRMLVALIARSFDQQHEVSCS